MYKQTWPSKYGYNIFNVVLLFRTYNRYTGNRLLGSLPEVVVSPLDVVRARIISNGENIVKIL